MDKYQFEKEIPRKKHYSKSKQSAKQEVINSKNVDPRFQQLIEDLNAFKSDFIKIFLYLFFYKLLHIFW